MILKLAGADGKHGIGVTNIKPESLVNTDTYICKHFYIDRL